MSDRYKGAILSSTQPTVTLLSANGIYTASQQQQYQGQGTWPQAYTAIARSLRFRSSASAYLNRTFGTATNSKICTLSDWVKRGKLTYSNPRLLDANNGGTSKGSQFYIIFNGSDQLEIGDYNNTILTSSQVFRDPSAWYHIVVAVDTTQATATNRIKVYVNGNLITYTQGASFPTQNEQMTLNTACAHAIGSKTSGASDYFDGYLTEINFIDGQALTPAAFGFTDPATGTWQPLRYGGTYGTNGFYLPFNISNGSFSGVFSGSNYLSIAANAAFRFGTSDFTIETFINPTQSGQSIAWHNNGGTGGSQSINGTIVIPTNQWSHIAVTKSGTTVRLYVNGVLDTSGTVNSDIVNNADPLRIGYGIDHTAGSGRDLVHCGETAGATPKWFFYLRNNGTGNYDGQMSNLRILKGTALYTGSTYTVPTTALTNITNTSVLTLQDSTIVDNSSNAFSITNTGSVTTTTANPFIFSVTRDFSGNNNNWTPNNISLINGSTYDSMTDVPTLTSASAANYAVLNPIGNPNVTIVTFSNGNLDFSHAASAGNAPKMTVMSTFVIPSGKWYWEFSSGSNVNHIVGISTELSAGGIASGSGYAAYTDAGVFVGTYTNPASGASFTNGDIIGMAYDQTAGTLAFYKNNVLQGTITNISTTNTHFAYRTVSTSASAGNGTFNFGQRPFAYTPPSGFVALNTFNLPTPTIGATSSTLANKYFDINLSAATGATRTVTGFNFQPDMVWSKNRTYSTNGRWGQIDSVRGVNKTLCSNLTDAEVTSQSDLLTAFNSDGFTLGADANGYGWNFNQGGNSQYAYWAWRANGTAVTNTAGSITSTVSANTSAGFSIVTFTTNNTAGATVGHGLGVAPAMIIVKYRSLGGTNWVVYHKNMSATPQNGYLNLNTTSAFATSTDPWNNTAPTSSVITMGAGVGSAGSTNYSVQTSVAYCFAEVAGYSKFGSYTGNGSSDGPFIFTGFRPRFVLIKRTDTTANWYIYDTARNTYNTMNNWLAPNLSDAENTATTWEFDFISNGFKLRNSGAFSNANGGTYIYAAFAESPFKYANAR